MSSMRNIAIRALPVTVSILAAIGFAATTPDAPAFTFDDVGTNVGSLELRASGDPFAGTNFVIDTIWIPNSATLLNGLASLDCIDCTRS